MQIIVGVLILLLGGVGLMIEVYKGTADSAIIIAAAALLVVGGFVAIGRIPDSIEFGSFKVSLRAKKTDFEQEYVERSNRIARDVKTKILSDDEKEEKARYVKDKELPGTRAPEYTVLNQARLGGLLVRPSAYPMTPMYLLDNAYRIVDWNDAFSLAFDRTMEGRQGKSVLEWTYHLENYQEVLDHGVEAFSDPDKLPDIDVETIEFVSLRYGEIKAVKRAYKIPDDNGDCLAWLVTMELDFADSSMNARYRYELLRVLGLDQMWSEYSVSYDKVLTRTPTYNELIDQVLGYSGPIKPVRDESRVLDLGAGTGNLTVRLASPPHNNLVFALDNNRVMLDFLRDKCRTLLREDDKGPGVVAIKQDVTSLFGIADGYFDYVVANNVFYALSDPTSSLQEVYRVLKPGGELRMSGPRNDTNLDTLFARLRADLVASGEMEELREEFQHVEQINRLRLNTMLYKWTTREFCELLEKIGFTVIYQTDAAYAGQSMLVAAQKPLADA